MKEDIRCIEKPLSYTKGFEYCLYLNKEVPIDVDLTSFHIKLSFYISGNSPHALTQCSYFYNYREHVFNYRLVNKKIVLISKKTDYMSNSANQMFNLVENQPKLFYNALWCNFLSKMYNYLKKSNITKDEKVILGICSYWEIYEQMNRFVKITFG